METVIKRYKRLFDELDNFRQVVFAESGEEEAVGKFTDYLIDAYEEGFKGAAYILGEDDESTEEDTERLAAALDYKYDGVGIFDKFKEYYTEGDLTALQTLMESEVHRVYNTACYDYAKQSRVAISKQWVTVGDDKVRATHAYLEGKSVPADGVFTTYDGDFARFPGDFTKAENNVGCRCILTYSKS